jgi:hypothetical protein
VKPWNFFRLERPNLVFQFLLSEGFACRVRYMESSHNMIMRHAVMRHASPDDEGRLMINLTVRLSVLTIKSWVHNEEVALLSIT